MIKAINLSKTYFQGKAKIEAVKRASLVISKKETVLITGPSGAGKSTLLHLLGGLDTPTDGKIIFDGQDFCTLSDKARSRIRNKKAGFVFQFYHLLPEFSVLENVILPALIKRRYEAESVKNITARAGSLLELVGLASRASHRPRELSGGESQRAAIARALINSPEILLCDEPTGNLDSKIGGGIMDSLWRIREKNGMALVIITHDEKLGYDFDKRFHIKDGILEE